jgi:hypothetical protein
VPIGIHEARHPQLRPAVAVHDVRFANERHIGRHEARMFGVDVVDDLERVARRAAKPQLGRAEVRAMRGECDLSWRARA